MGWERETKVIKTQSLSSKRLSPSKGDKCTKNYIRRLNRTRAINMTLTNNPGLQNYGRKRCKN